MSSEKTHRRSHSFPRAYRLKRRRLIRPLFDRSRKDVHSVTAGSIRILYRVAQREEAGENVPLQIGFTSGRGVRRAVTRNAIKRRLRETYRTHQHLLTQLFAGSPTEMLTVMVVFRGDPAKAAADIPTHLPTAFQRLVEKIQQGSTPH